ncbi:hypothetical protein [Angelakisella massiliensis]|uniref:hypothetical protein n=1 Tax=Angelakisella massiliensis TaxID=1871018 RepID=UPI0024B208D3|nr:hypothetical protein [Angelakisella massiliensis]
MEEQKENVREQAAEILENWKTLGWWDEEQTPEEQAALLVISWTADRMLAWCNIPLGAQVPQGMKGIWTELSYAQWQWLLEGGDAVGNAVSITQGDTAVRFRESSEDDPVSRGLERLRPWRRLP